MLNQNLIEGDTMVAELAVTDGSKPIIASAKQLFGGKHE